MTRSGMVRVARRSDARDIADIYGPIVRDTATSFEIEPPDAPELRRRIAATLEMYPWLVYENERGLSGYAYASAFHARPAYRWAAEVSVYVRARSRRRGVGRTLLTSLLDALRRQGFFSAVALIALPNEPSVTLFSSVGFRRVGAHHAVGYKLGRWHTVGRWERSLARRVANPSEPTPFEEL